MNQVEILEAKALMAKYMGAEVTQAYPSNKEQNGLIFYYPKDTAPDMYRTHSSESVKYFESYDWLMPVWFKVLKDIDFILPNFSLESSWIRDTQWNDCGIRHHAHICLRYESRKFYFNAQSSVCQREAIFESIYLFLLWMKKQNIQY